MAPSVSIVIPNRDDAATVGRSIEAALASRWDDLEVIVVDDASGDDSVARIGRLPCRLIRLDRHRGAAAARNAGARAARGEILFFTDADCILREDSVAIACATLEREGRSVAVGGTYAPLAEDMRFFSRFQSVFVHFAETRRAHDPDYLAAHALALRAEDFRRSGGFCDTFLPIIEDVEFSHRLRRRGYRLVMNPALQVGHVFGLSLWSSLSNAARKAHYWAIYSARNGDLLADSGTASRALKASGAACFACLASLAGFAATGQAVFLAGAVAILAASACANRRLLRAFFDAGGGAFAAQAAAYYLVLFPVAAGIGAATGLLRGTAWPSGRWERR